MGKSLAQHTTAIPGFPLNLPAQLRRNHLSSTAQLPHHPHLYSRAPEPSITALQQRTNTTLLKDAPKGSAPTLQLTVQPASSRSSHTAENHLDWPGCRARGRGLCGTREGQAAPAWVKLCPITEMPCYQPSKCAHSGFTYA